MQNNYFTENMKLADIITANYSLVLMLPRFNIPLGFGEKSVKEICEKNAISARFFLLVCNVYTFDHYQTDKSSFTDMEMTYLEGVATINMEAAQLIGVPWTFDALQTKKRPYDPENRAIKAHQPVFAEDAVLTFVEITSTGAVVTIPPATVTAPEGYSDVVQSYYVEVVDPTTGEVIKIAEIAAPYHIDDSQERLNQPVTLTITDLTPNTQYTILAYARECYQKASQPLTAQFVTVQ